MVPSMDQQLQPLVNFVFWTREHWWIFASVGALALLWGVYRAAHGREGLGPKAAAAAAMIALWPFAMSVALAALGASAQLGAAASDRAAIVERAAEPASVSESGEASDFDEGETKAKKPADPAMAQERAEREFARQFHAAKAARELMDKRGAAAPQEGETENEPAGAQAGQWLSGDGAALAAVGAGLGLAALFAWGWTRRLARRARPQHLPAIDLDAGRR